MKKPKIFKLSRIGEDAILEAVFGYYRKAMKDIEKKRKAFTEEHIWD